MWQRFGILGIVGVALLVVWAIGFLVLGWHEGVWHVLVPLGMALCVVQGVRRVAS